MNEEENKAGTDLISDTPNPNSDPSKEGDSAKTDKIDLDKYVPKDRYENAEKLIGTQGNELKEYRDFFKEIAPLLEKLEERPEITDAILSGKLDANLAKAVLEGKVKVEDATKVAKAHEEVKKEVGKEEYKGLSAEEIERLVAAKVEEQVNRKSKDIDIKISNVEKKREEKEFKESVVDFVANTPDYADYADAINEWLEEDSHRYDIRTAYEVVKGRALGNKSKEESEKAQAEEAKNLAANAAGGGSQGGKVSQEKPLIDELVGNNSNPNSV